jgi:hypothetical protein
MMAEQTIFQDKVTCGEWTFNDLSVLPPGVTQLGAYILDGWDDTPPLDVLLASRGTRDGDVPSEHDPYRSRQIRFGGWLHCVSRTAAIQARATMARSVFPRNTDLTFTRFEPGAAKQLTVRRAGEIEYPAGFNLTGGAFRFLVTLRAYDPLKYATTEDIAGECGVSGTSSGGRIYPRTYPLTYQSAAGQGNLLTVFNSGSHRTYPVTVLTGPLPAGWRWVNETLGVSLSLGVSLAEGSTLMLDHRREMALVGAVPLSPGIVGDWWPLEPGFNTMRLFGEYSAIAKANIVARSAWE